MNHTATAEPPPRANGRRLDAAEIKQQAAGRWREIIPAVCGIPAEVLDGKNHPCPSCGGNDRFAAFGDFAETGGTNCRACHSSGNGDGLATVMHFRGVELPEACKLVSDCLGGVAFSRPPAAPTLTQTPTIGDSRDSVSVSTSKPGYPGLKELLAKLPGPKHSRVDKYHNHVGALIGAAVRQDGPNGKQVRPASVGPDNLWRIQAMPEPRPLFCLPELLSESSATVYVAEGEKAAEAIRLMGFVATTWAGGSSAHAKTDWGPLAGRSVVLCPDSDDPGLKAMNQVADTLVGLSPTPTVRVLPPPDLADGSPMPPKGDAADYVASYADGESVETIATNWLAAVEQTAELIEQPEPEPRLAWRPFPVDTLPEPLRSHVKAIAASVQVDPSLAALPALCAAAAAIGGSRTIRLNHDWFEPSILWAAVVAKSGEGKTPAAKFAMEPSRRRDADSQQENAALLTQHRQDRAEYEVAKKAWEKKGGTAPTEPEPPTMLRYTVSDVTIEKLAEVLADNPRGVLLERDELSGLLGGFDRYSSGRGGAERAHYLSIHSGQAIQVDRKTGERRSISVDRPHVSIFGGIQPDLLRQVVGDADVAAGLPARFLFSLPPSVPKRWKRPPIPERVTKAVAAAMEQLFELAPTEGDNGRERAQVVSLDPEADQLFGEFFERHCAEGADLHGPLAAAWPKLRASAGRLLLVVHTIRAAAGESVDPLRADAESTRAAIALAGWFGNEARRVYHRRGESDAEREQRELVEWVEKRGGTVTPRDLSRGPRKYARGDAAELALQQLVDADLGAWQLDNHDGGRGRPVRRFTLAIAADADAYAGKAGNEPISVSVSSVAHTESEPDSDDPETWEDVA